MFQKTMQYIDHQKLRTKHEIIIFVLIWERKESLSLKRKIKIDGMILHYISKKWRKSTVLKIILT